MGESSELLEGGWGIKNPVMAIPQRDNMALVPFLSLMEETKIVLQPKDIQYGQAFTPNVEMRNHYQKMFGSGIVEATADQVKGLILN